MRRQRRAPMPAASHHHAHRHAHRHMPPPPVVNTNYVVMVDTCPSSRRGSSPAPCNVRAWLTCLQHTSWHEIQDPPCLQGCCQLCTALHSMPASRWPSWTSAERVLQTAGKPTARLPTCCCLCEPACCCGTQAAHGAAQQAWRLLSEPVRFLPSKRTCFIELISDACTETAGCRAGVPHHLQARHSARALPAADTRQGALPPALHEPHGVAQPGRLQCAGLLPPGACRAGVRSQLSVALPAAVQVSCRRAWKLCRAAGAAAGPAKRCQTAEAPPVCC